MFDDLRDLYQEVIFDHNRNPRNFRIIEDADRKVEGYGCAFEDWSELVGS